MMSDKSTTQSEFNERAIEGMAEKRLQRAVEAQKQEVRQQAEDDYNRPPTPRNFIELTDPQGAKLLVAIRAILVVEAYAGYGDARSKLTLSAAQSGGTGNELRVKEEYREVLQLLAQA
jgi:hypothetical protein